MALPVFVAALLQQGLSLLGNAALVKGKEWVEEKVGVKLDKPELAAEDVAKLKQYELEHEEELARIRLEDNRLELERDKAYLADVADARKRDTVFIAAGRRNERGDNLAYLAVGGLLVVLGLLFFVEISGDQKEILLVALGALLKIVGDVYAFEFGSSKGEQRKDNAMTKWLDESDGGKGEQ